MATLETEKDKVIVSLHSELQPDVVRRLLHCSLDTYPQKDPRAIAVQMHPATCPGYYTHDGKTLLALQPALILARMPEFVKQFDMRITSKADYIEVATKFSNSFSDKHRFCKVWDRL